MSTQNQCILYGASIGTFFFSLVLEHLIDRSRTHEWAVPNIQDARNGLCTDVFISGAKENRKAGVKCCVGLF